MLLFVPSSGAAPLTEFGQFGGQAGGGAGQIEGGEGIAVNATGAGGVEQGEIYVMDTSNQRVDQFTKDGEFVRTWGKNVNVSEPGTGFETCTRASGDTCQMGTQGFEAGAMSYPRGIAVDQHTGNVYVDENNSSRRIDVFSAEGKFEGGFGFGVDAAASAAELQFCTTATGCQAGESTAAAGGFSEGIYVGSIAIDPMNGDVWVGDLYNHRVNEFSVSLNGAEEVVAASFVRALGWNVNAGSPAEELQECTDLTGCKAGTEGGGQGQMNSPVALAVDSSGDLYVSSIGSPCTAARPCSVVKFNPDGTFKEQFGPASGGESKCQLNFTSGEYANVSSVTSLAVDPTDQHVFVTVKVSNTTYQICELSSEGKLLERSLREPAISFAYTGTPVLTLALGSEGRVDVLGPNASQTAWPVTIYGVVPAAPAELLPVTELTATGATLNGEITTPEPGGTGFDVKYRFEYSPDNGTTWLRAPVSKDATVGTTVPGPHQVQQKVSNLLPNDTYRLRLVTITSFTTTSEEKTFKTPLGPPRIYEMGSRDANQSSVTLEAFINPNGSPTNYRFEWGPTVAYGHLVPAEFEPPLGSGHEGSLVTANLTGLTPGAVYHFRIVARNGGGITTSPDQVAETLNSCGLPEGRCDELVSRREAGPVAIPGEHIVVIEMHYQAATSGPGLAYSAEAGYPDATHGAEVLYRGSRGATEWESTQLTPPLAGPNQSEGNSANGPVEWLANDLSCGFLWSNRPLTADPGTFLVGEYGSDNLYRVNADNSYTAVTDLTPKNPEDGVGSIAGGSQDCGKVAFLASYEYPGIPSVPNFGGSSLYEWEEGELRSVGYVPGPGGEEVEVAAQPGTTTAGGDQQNVVSEDGSRVFFTAQRQTSENPAEIGKQGVFVRENGTTTRDISLSETSVPDKGATYQWATPDGSAVFFLANAGLTTKTSSVGMDLYEYSLETEKLTDVSVDEEENGAEVAGFMTASADGSRVYFAARGQLVPDRGNTFAQNKVEQAYSIYSEHEGEYSYVGQVEEGEQFRRTTVAFQTEWTSQATPNGRYMIFESGQNITGYDSGGNRPEVYLYDADEGSEGTTICVSCRRDGLPSVAPSGAGPGFEIRYTPLPADQPINNRLHQPHYLTERDGRPIVFFSSPDPLAPGAVVDQNNVYEWSHGQVFRITSNEEGQQSPWPYAGGYAAPAGASNDASDFYFSTPENLTWEDGDRRLSVYDARIGGGYPQPSSPPAPCDPNAENSCQASPQQANAVPGPVTPTISGEQNFSPKEKSASKKKSQKKKHKSHKKGKKKHKGKKKTGKKNSKREANGNRRAGK
jgi:hypothetical protein